MEAMHRRKLILTIVCLLTIPITMPAFAASVSGFVRQPSNQPAVGALVNFACPGNKSFSATSDQYGRYRTRGLPDVQWCNLTVEYKGKTSASVRVNSGSGSREQNIKLQNSPSGWTVTL